MLVYRALGIAPPVIAHLPRILGPDGAKLSKRHGATSVFEYRDQGYLPDALFNFLGLIGWSLDDKTEIISRAQFIEHFTLDRVVKNPAMFNIEKLTWMNGVYIREMPGTGSRRDVRRVARPRPAGVGTAPGRSRARRAYRAADPRACEAVDRGRRVQDFFFVDELSYPKEELLGKAFAARPAEARDRAAARDRCRGRVRGWAHDALEATLRTLASELELKAGDLFSLVRVAVTGRRVTPPLFESMEILGRDRCLAPTTGCGRRSCV